MEHLGQRLLHARKSACLTQSDALAAARLEVGTSSISEWESGLREPSVAHLSRLADVYQRPFDWFLTDSPLVEQQIKWRQKPDSPGEIEARFRLLATYFHELETLCESKVPVALPAPAPVRNKRDAEILADKVRNELQLGPTPGHTLRARLEEACGVKLFCLEFEPSGTAATLCERDGIGVAILLNEKNSVRRLTFDLAHELYHVVALESADEEKLADAFAAQLLLPAEDFLRAVDVRSSEEGKIGHDAFLEVIREFGVSVEAAVWRLHTLRKRPSERSDVESTIRRLRLARNDAGASPVTHPPRFPERYVSLARRALAKGLISTGHYAKCLGISRNRAMADLSEFLESEGEDAL
jgi:Zn-dependent peptidase ImmA (M78 family)/transcriptional regulator with XRE-family HTH domain